jgi:hypothetical protein
LGFERSVGRFYHFFWETRMDPFGDSGGLDIIASWVGCYVWALRTRSSKLKLELYATRNAHIRWVYRRHLLKENTKSGR